MWRGTRNDKSKLHEQAYGSGYSSRKTENYSIIIKSTKNLVSPWGYQTSMNYNKSSGVVGEKLLSAENDTSVTINAYL